MDISVYLKIFKRSKISCLPSPFCSPLTYFQWVLYLCLDCCKRSCFFRLLLWVWGDGPVGYWQALPHFTTETPESTEFGRCFSEPAGHFKTQSWTQLAITVGALPTVTYRRRTFWFGRNKLKSHFKSIFRAGSSVQFSCSVMSDSLRPHGLQHARLLCSSPIPETCSNSRPSS